MRKTILLAGCALLLGTTVIASDFAADPLNFRNPQRDLILVDNLSEMLRETKELQSCEKQQEEALQRFLGSFAQSCGFNGAQPVSLPLTA
jgi:hypothetical protein